ncbi:prepilin-type N-terminal cleavage/methylation domain-containing protein [Pontiella sp.]|uniref:prepilin-type N-terminal cleavage/methylation domain-containing protein n=1 Tax=Pontiella sp. TaxID=2837462 RepID=UPI0035670F9A
MGDGRKSGFTLVELIVVLAIVAVLVTIGVPALAAFSSPKETLRKEGRRVMRLMNEARQVAQSRKIRIEIRIDPVMNELRAVESNAYRSLMANHPDGLIDRQDEDWLLAMSNRYERTVAFGEEIGLEGFSIEDIEAPFQEDDAFRRLDRVGDYEVNETPEAETVALAFSHFGGSDGGGVSLFYKETTLNIAADILTGKPKVVNRRTGEPASGRGGAL